MTSPHKRAEQQTLQYLKMAAAGMPGTPYSHMSRDELIAYSRNLYNTGILNITLTDSISNDSKEVNSIKAMFDSRGTESNKNIQESLLTGLNAIQSGGDPDIVIGLQSKAMTGTLNEADEDLIEQLSPTDKAHFNKTLERVKKHGTLDIPERYLSHRPNDTFKDAIDPSDPVSVTKYLEHIRPKAGEQSLEYNKLLKSGFVSEFNKSAIALGYETEESQAKRAIFQSAITGGALSISRIPNAFRIWRQGGNALKKTQTARNAASQQKTSTPTTRTGSTGKSLPKSTTPKPARTTGGVARPTRKSSGMTSIAREMAVLGGLSLGAGLLTQTDSLPDVDISEYWDSALDGLSGMVESIPDEFKQLGSSILAGAAAGLLGSGLPQAGLRRLINAPIAVAKKALNTARFKSEVERRSSVEGAAEIYESQNFAGETGIGSLEGEVSKADKESASSFSAIKTILGAGLLTGIAGILTSALRPITSFITKTAKPLFKVLISALKILGLSRLLRGGGISSGPIAKVPKGKGGALALAAIIGAGIMTYSAYDPETGTVSLEKLSDNMKSGWTNMTEAVSGMFSSSNDQVERVSTSTPFTPSVTMVASGSSFTGDSRYAQLAELVHQGESPGANPYNRLVWGKKTPHYANLTDMTVAEVIEYQKGMISRGHASTAVGKYQYITNTLQTVVRGAGIPLTAKFDQRTQDKMFVYSAGKVRNVESYFKNPTPENLNKAVNSLAYEWASLKNMSGKGAYDGDSVGNKAKIDANLVAQAISQGAYNSGGMLLANNTTGVASNNTNTANVSTGTSTDVLTANQPTASSSISPTASVLPQQTVSTNATVNKSATTLPLMAANNIQLFAPEIKVWMNKRFKHFEV